MRTIRINGVKCDASKSEAEFVGRIQTLKNRDIANRHAIEWLRDAPTEEAKLRRKTIINAMFGSLVPA